MSCGESLAPGSRFCARCGASVGVGATATSPLMPTTPSPATPTPIQYHGRFDPGTRLGTRYRIVGLLGRGGMGEVYRADDLELGQPVALKFLPGSATPAELDRLRREVRIAREISHPNVCRTYDISAADGQAFLVMEYIDGEDLASVLRRMGRPSRDKAIEIARQLCLGLGAAHEHNILHRDLKPANIMIDGRGRVRITDFGLAAMTEELSRDGTVSGTPAYMAPEQLKGAPASIQSDIYALGLILYELFTGKRAFDSRTPAQRLQTDSTPKSPSSLTPDIEPATERVILRCLEREPQSRPGSAYAVLGALPGGDPLAAALAAGETPSPELVASARVEGSVKPGIALACVLFFVAALVWYAYSETNTLQGFTRSDTFLALRAEDILAKAGIEKPPRYVYGGFDENRVYTKARARLDSVATAQKRPKYGRDMMSLYWREWSPAALVSADLHDPAPTLFKPPVALPGSVLILMEPGGRLISLSMLPQRADSLNTGTADWPGLVSVAGYDAAHMTRVAPLAHPLIDTDSLTAWSVTGARPTDPGVTLLAGWLGGKIVHVSMESDWGSTLDPFAFRNAGPELSTPQLVLYFTLAIFLPLAAGSFFAMRNLKAGRGDRKGATVLALFVFATYWMAHLLSQDFRGVGIFESLLAMLNQIPIGHSMLHAVTVWIMYVAVEPYLRRLWPRVLVSWARLINGHARDPIIGRDILVGFAYAGVVTVVHTASSYLGSARPPEPPVNLYLSLGGPAFANVLYGTAIAFLQLMGYFTLLLVARLALRRNDLAIGVAIVVIGLFSFMGGDTSTSPIGAVVVALVASVGLTVIALRFGFFAALVGGVLCLIIPVTPWTTDPSVWYSGQMMIVVAAFGALLLYGLLTALGGRSILKDPMLEGTRDG